MFTSSRRVFGVATALTLGALIAAPSASAALLGSDGSTGSVSLPALSGVTNSLPLSGNLLAPVQGLLGGGLLGGSGGVLAPVAGLLGGSGGLTGVLGGTGLLGGSGGITGVLGGVTSVGAADSAGGTLLDGVLQSVGGTTLACDAAAPQALSAILGGVGDTVCALNPFDGGLAGLLGVL